MKQVYVLKNKLSGTYEDPFFKYEPWESSKRQIHDFCLLNPAKAKENHLDECLLIWLGTFDELDGKIVLFDAPDYYDVSEAFQQMEAIRRSLPDENK